MAERLDVEYIGMYKCSARATQVLSHGASYVDSAMVDHFLFAEFADMFRLDVGKDNKSVWDPRWLVRGLARFGGPVSATLVGKFDRQPDSSQEIRGSRTNRKEQRHRSRSSGPPGRRVPQRSTKGRAVGVTTNGRSDGSPVAWTIDSKRRVLLSVRGDIRNRGRFRDGFDPLVYEQAKHATLRAAGGRSRRYAPKDEAEVVDEVLHLDKSAGAPFFCDVATALPRAREYAHRVRMGNRAFDPYVAYKRIQHGHTGPKGRFVWGSPLATTILSSTFAKAAYEGVKRRRAFAYGYRKGEIGAFLSEFQSRYKRVYSVDFSGFDSSVPAKIIGDAFEVLKSHLDLNPEERDLYYRLTNDFIHSRVIMPDRTIYQKHRGIPSGSPFTSLIGSICNLLVLNYMWIKITGVALDGDRVLVLGDDSVVATNSNVSLEQLADAAADVGMQVDLEDSKVAQSGDRVVFLGHSWEKGRPHRQPREVAIRLTFEEKHRPQSDSMTCMRMYGMMSDSVEAYQLVAKVIHHHSAALDSDIQQLASRAKTSPMCLARAGPGRLRYLAAVEPDLMLEAPFSNGKLAACGIFQG